jgi:chromosome segregation ATPase
MSEDKTKILGDEEPTEDLAAQKAATTNPMLEAILARMNEGFAQIDTKFAEFDTKFAEFDTKFAELNTKVAELNTKVAELNTKVDMLTSDVREIKGYQRVFNDQLLRVQSHLFEHEERLNNLERKAS